MGWQFIFEDYMHKQKQTAVINAITLDYPAICYEHILPRSSRKKALRSLRCGKCFANLGRLRYRLSGIWFSSVFLQIKIAPALYFYAIATNASFYLAKY